MKSKIKVEKCYDELFGSIKSYVIENNRLMLTVETHNGSKKLYVVPEHAKLIIEQLESLCSKPTSKPYHSGYPAAGRASYFATTLYNMIHNHRELKFMIEDNRLYGIASPIHLQLTHANQRELFAAIHTTLLSYGLASGPFDSHHGYRYFFNDSIAGSHPGVVIYLGKNIPQPKSGFTIRRAYYVQQCSNWGIFANIRQLSPFFSEFEKELSQLLKRYSNKLVYRKGTFKRFKQRVIAYLKDTSTVSRQTKHSLTAAQTISMNRGDQSLILKAYQKTGTLSSQLVYQVRQRLQQEPKTLWGLIQALTYTATHQQKISGEQQLLQKGATELLVATPIFSHHYDAIMTKLGNAQGVVA